MYQEAGNANLIMLLNTALLPFVASLAIGYIASKWLKCGTYLGYLAGFFVGLSLIHSGFSLPPKQAIDYLSATIVIGLIGHLIELRETDKKYSIAIIYSLVALSFYWLLNPVLKHTGLSVSLLGVFICTLVSGVYLQLEKVSRRRLISNTPLVSVLPYVALMVIAAAAAPVVGIGGSLLLAQLLGAFAAAMFAYCLLAVGFKQKALSPFGAWLIYAGLMAQSHVLADISIGVVALSILTSLLIPLSLLTLKRPPSLKQALMLLARQAVVSAAVMAVSLYWVWPASSLY
ncbi:hypothetical protein [Marinomonas sp.]